MYFIKYMSKLNGSILTYLSKNVESYENGKLTRLIGCVEVKRKPKTGEMEILDSILDSEYNLCGLNSEQILVLENLNHEKE